MTPRRTVERDAECNGAAASTVEKAAAGSAHAVDSVSENTGRIPIDRAVSFLVADQCYAIPVDRIQEIQQIVAFSTNRKCEGPVVGMVNLRGLMVPALDMRALLGVAPVDYTLETSMVICWSEGQLLALVVDSVRDVIDMPEDRMQPAPALHALAAEMLGVCRLDHELVHVLDIDALIAGANASSGSMR